MKVSLDPATILHPHPVLVIGSYGEDGKPNLATASWGGICCGDPPCVAVSFRKATLTYHNLMHSKAFTVAIPSQDQVAIADYLGIASGRDVDKFKKAGLTPVKSPRVEAPFAEEFSYCLECQLLQFLDLGLHTQFIGRIVGLQADPSVLNDNRLPDVEKTKPFVFGSHGSQFYYSLGERIGKPFSIGKTIGQPIGQK